METQKDGSIAKPKEVKAIEEAKKDVRGRSGSTSEHSMHQKKKASNMQKTFLEDA